MGLLEYLSAFANLFYPGLCVVCGRPLVQGEKWFCTSCKYHFPYSYEEHTGLELKFRAECELERVYSLFRYRRESPYKHLIHVLKYRGRRELGRYLGRLLGEKILDSFDECMGPVEAVIPLPLHPERRRIRGYNQAEEIAEGIAEVLGIPLLDRIVSRVKNNPSQTGLDPEQRQKNVEHIFALEEPYLPEGVCHVLLVDDVITTGATLVSCLRVLSMLPGIRLSVACLGVAGE